jgi:phage terminase small subunit
MSRSNPLLNVVPFKPGGGQTPQAYTAPETRLEDELPEKAPDYYPATVTEQRIFKWLRVHGLTKGLHKETDALALHKLSKAVALSIALEQSLDQTGVVYETVDRLGNTQFRPRPEVAMLARANKEINELIKLLELHPRARRTLVPHNRKVTSDVNRWGT